MRTITLYPNRIVPDGDPCDHCPRTLGRGGRYVRITEVGLTRLLALCARCTTRIRKTADHVRREV